VLLVGDGAARPTSVGREAVPRSRRGRTPDGLSANWSSRGRG